MPTIFEMPRPPFPPLSIIQAYRKRVPGIVSRVFEDLYSRATLTLRLCDGKWRVWRAGRGTRQGDYRRRYLLCSRQRCCLCGEGNKTAPTTADRSTQLSSPSWTTLPSSRSTRKPQQKEKRHCSALRNSLEKTPIHWFRHWLRSDVSWSYPRGWSYQCGWALERWLQQSNHEPIETHRWNEGHHSKILGRLHQSQRHQQHDHP